MKPLLATASLLVFFVAAACSHQRASRIIVPPPERAPAQASEAPPQPPPVAPTPPPDAPKPPAAPVQGPMIGLEEAMQKVSDSDLEGSLERWAEGKEIDLAHVIKRTGVFVDVAPRTKWDDNKKRAIDAADHDRLVRDSIDKAKALVAAAQAGKTAEIKPLSDQLLQTCVDCHTKYK